MTICDTSDSSGTRDTCDSISAIGIDLGGTNLRAAKILAGKICSESINVPTPDGSSNIIDALVELIERFKAKETAQSTEEKSSGSNMDRIAGVGIATAGVVNCDTGEVIGSTGNLPGWAGTKIRKEIEARVGLPVHVENDANAAAYAESKIDALKNKKCILAVTLGTGIGGGVIFDGRLHYGSGWAAGEIGHIRISMNNERLCTCGLYDCWEAFGSGRGLKATAVELLDGVSPGKTKLADNLEDISTYEIFDQSAKGDLIAEEIIHKWHEHIAIGMVNLTHILNPDCFVVSGGLSEICDITLLKKMVVDRTLHNIGDSIEIRKSELDTNAGLIGAAQCVIDKVLVDDQRLATQAKL